MDLSVIIVSWNVRDLLKNCLESVFRFQGNLNLEVIVVDNASDDGSAEMVRKEFPQVKLFASQKNLGFSKGNNLGIRESSGDYLLILNPDTEILQNSIIRMINFVKNREKIGIAGCKHLNPNLTIQQSVRRLPTFLPLFLIMSKIAKIFPNLESVAKYLARDFNYKIAQKAPQVAGSFMIVRRQMLKQIGLFDEKFFIWFEEVDLCKRTWDNGWEVWYSPVGEIIHHGGQSFRQKFTLKKQEYFFKSAWYYFKKHGLLFR